MTSARTVTEEHMDYIADFFETNLLQTFIEEGEVAMSVAAISEHLTEISLGVACWDYYFQKSKELNEEGYLENALYDQNDLRFIFDNLEVRSHRVDPNTRVPNGGKVVKREASSNPYLFLPGIGEFIIEKTGSVFVGKVIDKDEGLQEVFVGMLYSVNGKAAQCNVLRTIYDKNAIVEELLPEIDHTSTNTSDDKLVEKRQDQKITEEENGG